MSFVLEPWAHTIHLTAIKQDVLSHLTPSEEGPQNQAMCDAARKVAISATHAGFAPCYPIAGTAGCIHNVGAATIKTCLRTGNDNMDQAILGLDDFARGIRKFFSSCCLDIPRTFTSSSSRIDHINFITYRDDDVCCSLIRRGVTAGYKDKSRNRELYTRIVIKQSWNHLRDNEIELALDRMKAHHLGEYPKIVKHLIEVKEKIRINKIAALEKRLSKDPANIVACYLDFVKEKAPKPSADNDEEPFLDEVMKNLLKQR